MKHKILNRTTYITVNTEVEYDFNGIKVIIEIPHFNPQSEDDITLGIENRAVTEQEKLKESK